MKESMTIEPAMNSLSRKNITTVINEFGKRLLGFIRQRVNNEADAEDILQDVWYQFTTTLDSEPIEKVSNWLFTVARNKITDRYRKKKPESLDDSLTFENEDGEVSFKEILLADNNNPETEHLRNMFWKELQDALEELPDEQRNVFIWNEMEDIPFKQISERTGVSVNTLLSRKRYAVVHLRARLQILYNEIINY
jgi:RNA polymerase sigma factor (sigma-70 family)